MNVTDLPEDFDADFFMLNVDIDDLADQLRALSDRVNKLYELVKEHKERIKSGGAE